MPDTDSPAIPLLVSTRNAHKVGEIRAILGSRFLVCDLSALPDMPDIEETGETFEENAGLKAVAASGRFDGWVIADDSGLEVDALGGAPGVRSARYAGKQSDDQANNFLLLRNLEGVRGKARSARFRCVIVLAKAGEKLGAFSGAVEGTIINAPKGTGGFGYDPLFVPDGHCETFAQLGAETKNSLSHRARALEGLLGWSGWSAL
ncbi:MAG: RdgB/HAM1 family non-canonical purine NTP pyrophosphatase [Verrucomicrobiaceae bacterium]|nr:MAG: RdgB/HAM1 family non-canonical purine NTP pyrophosphatase [Verrucomicrobiaceae bacterium]